MPFIQGSAVSLSCLIRAGERTSHISCPFGSVLCRSSTDSCSVRTNLPRSKRCDALKRNLFPVVCEVITYGSSWREERNAGGGGGSTAGAGLAGAIGGAAASSAAVVTARRKGLLSTERANERTL